MVQGNSPDYSSKVSSATASRWEKASAKRSGYEAVQRVEKERQKQSIDSKYGAWGPTFKGRDQFASMHHC